MHWCLWLLFTERENEPIAIEATFFCCVNSLFSFVTVLSNFWLSYSKITADDDFPCKCKNNLEFTLGYIYDAIKWLEWHHLHLWSKYNTEKGKHGSADKHGI